jgi:RNA polymerase subunit RPABC4/transcription elongation factor Spt4
MNKEQENCPYCHGQKDLINTVHYDDPYGTGEQLGQAVHIEGNMLVVEEDTCETKKIGYCPMCGRDLRGERR